MDSGGYLENLCLDQATFNNLQIHELGSSQGLGVRLLFRDLYKCSRRLDGQMLTLLLQQLLDFHGDDIFERRIILPASMLRAADHRVADEKGYRSFVGQQAQGEGN